MKKCYLLAQSQTHAYLSFLEVSTGPRTCCPENHTTHRGLDSPISINNQGNPSQTCPKADIIQVISQLNPSQVTLGCFKLTVKANQEHLCLGYSVFQTFMNKLEILKVKSSGPIQYSGRLSSLKQPLSFCWFLYNCRLCCQHLQVPCCFTFLALRLCLLSLLNAIKRLVLKIIFTNNNVPGLSLYISDISFPILCF